VINCAKEKTIKNSN